MDNRTIDVTSEGEEGVSLALQLIWPNAIGGKVTHVEINRFSPNKKEGYHSTEFAEDVNGTPTLILYWNEHHHAKPLPFPLGLNETVGFVQNWLRQVEYGPQPDHDGHNNPGWRIFTEGWGHVAGRSGTVVAVQPAWAMYGK